MIPISTIVPMAMAMAIPASDMMLASTLNSFIAINDISTAVGRVTAMIRLARMCSRNSTITTMVINVSSASAVVRVVMVSSINCVRSYTPTILIPWRSDCRDAIFVFSRSITARGFSP